MKKFAILLIVFCLLVGTFAALMGPVAIPVFRNSQFIIIFGIALFLLGLTLIFLTLKQRVEGKLKKFLILTGASAVGLIVSVLLHNIFYGVSVVVGHITALKYLAEALHVAFFLIAIPICPLAFLVGVVGSVVLFFTERKREKAP